MRTPVSRLVLIALSLVAVLVQHPVMAQEEVILYPRVRLDPGTSATRYALEFTGTARGHEVIGLWMKRPPNEANMGNDTIGMAYSNDCGVTWTISDLHTPDEDGMQSEYDPMTCFDPRTLALFVGAMKVTDNYFVKRLDFGEMELTEGSLVAEDNAAHEKPWMAAGPKPGEPNTTRLYVAGGFPSYMEGQETIYPDIVWSDDLGEMWSSSADAGSLRFALPRIGNAGELYVGTILTDDTVRMSRSFSLNTAGVPSFSPQSTIATVQTGFTGAWFPGEFRVPQIIAMAVDPNDGKRVFAVWPDKTSEVGNQKNVDLYFSMTEDATGDEGQIGNPITWTTPKIIPAGIEVAGDQFFPWLECTEDGRLHLLFMDGRHNPNQLDSGNGGDEHGLFDYYYAMSDDDGDTWEEHRFTPASFDVADGTVVIGGTFFGDYLGMAATGKRLYPFYADIAGVLPRPRPSPRPSSSPSAARWPGSQWTPALFKAAR